jgi:hypothetical protein
MNSNDSLTLIEKLRYQIKEEQRKYRSALNNNLGFLELKEIKNNIQRLQSSLQKMMNKLREYKPINVLRSNNNTSV